MVQLFRLLCPVLLASLALLAGCSESSGQETTNESGATSSDYPTTWRFALEEIEGSFQHLYAKHLRDRIETISDGRIVVDVFPYSSLGTSTQLTELTANGSIDLAFASPGHLADRVPESGVFNLHFLLPEEADAAQSILQNPALTAELQPAYQASGLHLLGLVSEGWMAWTANKPLQTPGDFQELKFRTMTSKTAAQSFRAYGAEPVQTPYAEVYSDLQLHRIHGQSNPVFAIEEMGFHDVQSHMTLPKASRFVSSLIANPEWFAGLTERERQWLTDAVEDLSGQAWDIAQQLNQERLDTMVERGDIKLVTLSDQERAAFRKASQQARMEFIKATDEKGQTLLSLMENGHQAP